MIVSNLAFRVRLRQIGYIPAEINQVLVRHKLDTN